MVADNVELRRITWDALLRTEGNREKAAEMLGVSLRTLNRYIHNLNLYADMDKAGLLHNVGPPRINDKKPRLTREARIVAHIKANRGQLDYQQLALEMYRCTSKSAMNRVYTALTELKRSGKIGHTGTEWFVLDIV